MTAVGPGPARPAAPHAAPRVPAPVPAAVPDGEFRTLGPGSRSEAALSSAQAKRVANVLENAQKVVRESFGKVLSKSKQKRLATAQQLIASIEAAQRARTAQQ